MDMIDIVYFVKESNRNEELVYSLRSLKNFFPNKEKRVIFIGGWPLNLRPDFYIDVFQNQGSKYGNVHKMMEIVATNPNINKEFFLFNDDFFINQEITEWKPQNRGSLYKYIVDIENRHGFSSYTIRLRKMINALDSEKKTTYNYELHIPMKINKEKLKKVLRHYGTLNGVRSLYGNNYFKNTTERNDVKVYDLDQTFDKDSDYLSTDDITWKRHDIGDYIRNKFVEPSRFEIEENI